MNSIVVFLAGQAIAIIVGLISIYVKVSLKLKELEVRVSMVEKNEDSIDKKLDNIIETINKLGYRSGIAVQAAESAAKMVAQRVEERKPRKVQS
jgi:hypothetical protein